VRQAAFVIVALFFLASGAAAQPTAYGLGVSLASSHFGHGGRYPCNFERGPRYESYREINPGLAGRVIFSPALEAEVGLYANSVHQTSLFAATTWAPLAAGPLRAGLLVGAATGYCQSVVPVAALALNYWLVERLALQVLIAPPTRANAGVIGSRILYNF